MLEREVATQLEGETSCCGVTLAQCHSLLELAQRSHSLTALAVALDLDKSTLSRTVESMVKSGLCERTAVAGDRRSVRLTLTSFGRSKVDTINRICDEYYNSLLEQLSESDQRQIVRAVRTLSDAMRRLRISGKAQPSCCTARPSTATTATSLEAQPDRAKRRSSKQESKS